MHPFDDNELKSAYLKKRTFGFFLMALMNETSFWQNNYWLDNKSLFSAKTLSPVFQLTMLLFLPLSRSCSYIIVRCILFCIGLNLMYMI